MRKSRAVPKDDNGRSGPLPTGHGAPHLRRGRRGVRRRATATTWSNSPVDRQFLDDFAVLGEGGAPVIDVGCGPGQVAAYLADQGIKVIGIDLAPRMLQVAHRLQEGRRDRRRLPSPPPAWNILRWRRRLLLAAVRATPRVAARPAGDSPRHTDGRVTRTRYPSRTWRDPRQRRVARSCRRARSRSRSSTNRRFASPSPLPHSTIDETRYREPLPHEHQGPRVYVRATATT